jgi:hypothetical protein
MGDWGERPLSGVGREILIKLVVQEIPTYSMGIRPTHSEPFWLGKKALEAG